MAKEKQPKDPAEQGKEIKTAADLIQDENNYRKHSETNKARIKKSIDEYYAEYGAKGTTD